MSVELRQNHWVNGRRFEPGTVLELPPEAAANLLAWGVAVEPDAPPSPEPTD